MVKQVSMLFVAATAAQEVTTGVVLICSEAEAEEEVLLSRVIIC